jgi:uncharacterized membrane protein SirB2
MISKREQTVYHVFSSFTYRSPSLLASNVVSVTLFIVFTSMFLSNKRQKAEPSNIKFQLYGKPKDFLE